MTPVILDKNDLPSDEDLERIHKELTLLCAVSQCVSKKDESVPRKRRDLSDVRGKVR